MYGLNKLIQNRLIKRSFARTDIELALNAGKEGQ